MNGKRHSRNRHRSLKVAAKTALKLLLAQVKYVDIKDFYAGLPKSPIQIHRVARTKTCMAGSWGLL